MEHEILSKVPGVSARDVMVGQSLEQNSTENHMFATGKLTQAFENADPFMVRNKRSLSLF